MSAARVTTMVLALLLSSVMPGVVLGGKNAGGALIVHADDTVIYSSGGDYCGRDLSLPASCSAARTRVNPSEDGPILVWIIAAFSSNASPEVTGVRFGIEHTLSSIAIRGWQACDQKWLEIPEEDFPSTDTGTIIAIPSGPIRETFFPIYWFAINGESGDTFATAADPRAGDAEFSDDGNPPAVDRISRFGHVGWGVAGANQCPPSSIEIRSSSWGGVKAGYR